MKKLMIAAAAAAMIGGAEAAITNLYDFVANVQTTGGASAGQATSYGNWLSIDLGANGTNPRVSAYKHWWKADKVLEKVDAVTNGSNIAYSWKTNAEFKVYRESGLAWEQHSLDGAKLIPTLVNRTADGVIKDTNDTVMNWLRNLRGAYQFPALIGGSPVYCCTIQYRSSSTSGGCYRVPAGDYFQQKVALITTDCCTDGSKCFWSVYQNNRGEFVVGTDPNYDKVIAYGTATMGFNGTTDGTTREKGAFLHRFGAPDPANATSLELWAQVKNCWLVVANARFAGYLAGQGWMNKLDGEDVPQQISGNIVGSAEYPLCDVCCDDASPALAFDCDSELGEALNTAAFGTFYLVWVGTL